MLKPFVLKRVPEDSSFGLVAAGGSCAHKLGSKA